MSRRKIPSSLAEKIRKQARHRCGYCLLSEILIGMLMEFEHLIPLAAGGLTVEENLWLSCRICNGFKGALTHAADPETKLSVPLFNPRQQNWSEHFRWSEDGTEIIGQTPTGRATVVALRMNNPTIVNSRRLWVSVGWWPPLD
jgi:hypothetical protein